MSATRLVLGNLLVFLAIVLGLNLLSAVILDVQYFFKQTFFAADSRGELPNYRGADRDRKSLDEWRKLRTTYAPYVVWSREPFAGETITVNQEGDRVHEPTTTAPLGTVRFFGGSTMWGMGVADESSIPAQWNRLFPDYAVHNHGEAGFYTRQSIARLVNLVSEARPMDLVVFYDGANDVGTLCRFDVPLNGNKRTEQIRRRVNPSSHLLGGLIGAIREVLLGEFFKVHVYHTYERPIPCEDPGYAQRVARVIVQNWKIAHALACRAGADFLAVLQPVATVGSPRVDHLDPSAVDKPAYDWVYPRVQELVRRENAGWLLDFTRIFDGDEYIYIDENHVTANGNRIVAESLRPYTEALLDRRRESGEPPDCARPEPVGSQAALDQEPPPGAQQVPVPGSG